MVVGRENEDNTSGLFLCCYKWYWHMLFLAPLHKISLICSLSTGVAVSLVAGCTFVDLKIKIE